MTLSSFIIEVAGIGTLVSHILIVLFLIALVARVSIAQKISKFLTRYAFHLVFVISSLGALGSLLFSEFMGFEPCVLCWWGRIFLYPTVIISLISIIRRDKGIAPYILGLSIPGALVSLYHAYTQLGGFSLTPCTAVGGACSKIYILEFGYISIPMMAFTAFLLIIITMVIKIKHSEKNNLVI